MRLKSAGPERDVWVRIPPRALSICQRNSAPVLRERENLSGPEIERILREHDPERPNTGRHSQSGPVFAPWYKVFSDNSKQARLLYEGDDEVEASRIARLHPDDEDRLDLLVIVEVRIMATPAPSWPPPGGGPKGPNKPSWPPPKGK
jgi:hypothetical protein